MKLGEASLVRLRREIDWSKPSATADAERLVRVVRQRQRSRSDGLSGFVGTLIRGEVRGEAEKGMLAALRITKARMERP